VPMDPVIEIALNEGELTPVIRQADPIGRRTTSIAYYLGFLLGEPMTMRTYRCEVT
jgi:hypothetical protein